MRASAPSTAEDTRPKEQEFTRLPSVPFGRLSDGQPGKYTESHDPTAAGGNHLSRAARIGGIRVYREADVELLRNSLARSGSMGTGFEHWTR